MKKELLEKVGEVVPEETLRVLLNEWNPIICVDRTVCPTYPDFVKEVKYPELELTGPAEFDAGTLGQWLHPKQESGIATGNEILEELIAKKLLEGCLGLVDLQAIQARGSGFSRKHFLMRAIPGWKSVVLNRNGNFNVPYLRDDGVGVELDWYCLDYFWDSFSPALRHA